MKYLLRPPRTLAFRIFGTFWVAMTLAGAFLLTLEANRTERLTLRARAVNGDAIAFYAVSVAKDHEDEKTWQSRDFLQDLETRTGIHAWLLDARGREVSGHDASGLRWLQAQTSALRHLREKAEVTQRTVFEPLSGFTLAAHTAIAPSGRGYTFVAILPQSRFGPWSASPLVQGLRFLAVLITSGIVSWIVARSLTRSIIPLRTTTHHLAEGDWSARVDPKIEKQPDELGDLAQDFNLMAERLETSMLERDRLVVAQKRLLADVAHELRSPLARISVALELARDAHTPPANQKVQQSQEPLQMDAHNRIEREVIRLSELIARLLTLSRLESGVARRDDTPIDIRLLVEGVVADADYEARPHKNVAFHMNAPIQTLNSYFVPGTPDLLRSAVENVVRNAVRHTPKSTTVQVMLSLEINSPSHNDSWNVAVEDCFISPLPASPLPPTCYAIVKVLDQGSGIPLGELRDVFQPFYRAGQPRTSRDGGVGLGLSIVLRAVELHGGQIRACNAAGTGFQVEMRLPLEPHKPLPK